MNTEEAKLDQVWQHLQRQAEIAQQQNNLEALRDAYLRQVEPCAKLAQLHAHDYDFVNADYYLKHLQQIIDWLSQGAIEKEKDGLLARLLYSEAIVRDVKGTYDLFEKMDFVDAPVELEQAEKRYERTAELYSKLGVKSSDQTLLAVRGMALRSRGIRLFGQGKYNIEAGDNKTAQDQLKESKRTLDQAAQQLRPLAEAGELDPGSAMHPDYSLSLAFYSQAYFFRAKAEQIAFELRNYRRCAHSLSQQIKALGQAKDTLQQILGLNVKVPDSLAHRLAQEIDLCDKRQKYFAAEGEKQPKRSFTLGTVTFAVLALGSISIQLWSFNYFNFKMELLLYIIAVTVALVIGGVGAGLATWGEATAFFGQIVAKIAKPKDENEKKEGKNNTKE